MNQILTSPLFNLLNLALAVLGLLLAYVFYRKSLRLKEPCWDMQTTNLIAGYSASFSELEVLFRGERIENLSISRIAFWNQGADTIHASDIPSTSPFRIMARDVRLLDAKILRTKHESCNLSVGADEKGLSANLSFDYCDFGQGVLLQVAHTGTGTADISLVGAFKGARPLARRETMQYGPLFIMGAGAVMGGGMIAVGSMEPDLAIDPLLIVAGIILIVAAAFTTGRYWRNRVPSGLELQEGGNGLP